MLNLPNLLSVSSTVLISVPMLVCFFALMIFVGFACRKHSTNVDGFVLGGRAVGPWLTAFAFGTSYFSAVIFVGYAGQFGWNFGLAPTPYSFCLLCCSLHLALGDCLRWSASSTQSRLRVPVPAPTKRKYNV